MTTKTQHTALPSKDWFTTTHEFNGEVREGLAIVGPDFWMDHLNGCIVTDAKTAAFICKAVNNHEMLVEQLQAAQSALEDAYKFMGRGFMGDTVELHERINNVARSARTVLAQLGE